MSNHGWISTKANLKIERVAAHLDEINCRRFRDKLTIEEISKAEWHIKYNETRPSSPLVWEYCSLWICSPRRIEFRHPHNSWIYYVQVVFTEELAQALRGKLSDEGLPPPAWEPHPEKYPSYKSWIDILYANGKNHLSKIQYEDLIGPELNYAPAELRDC